MSLFPGLQLCGDALGSPRPPPPLLSGWFRGIGSRRGCAEGSPRHDEPPQRWRGRTACPAGLFACLFCFMVQCTPLPKKGASSE